MMSMTQSSISHASGRARCASAAAHRLFLTDIDWNDETGAPEPHTRELAGEWLDEDPAMYTPVLNPRIAPDGEHVLYTTGSYLMLVDIGGELGDRITAVYGVSVEDEDGNPAENTWKIGLAEFVAGEEMDRYDGFWWAPDPQCRRVSDRDHAGVR